MVRPEQILKELSHLWKDLGHEQQEDAAPGEPGAGVLRACAMTLITIADESEDPTNVGETVAMLMKDHPSRSVLIRLRASGNETLESRVFAQCWMPFGQRRQICCEQIEITASPAKLDDVPGVVLPLAVPDLPVILWCRSPGLFETAAFPRVAAMSGKLILDSGTFADTSKALQLISDQIASGRLTADLAWSRLTRWRETVSQVFINQECMQALSTYTRVQVEHGTERPRPEVLYLAAWLQNGLAAAGNSTQVELVRGDGPAIAALILEGGNACDVNIRCDRSGAVDVTANKLDQHTIFPEATDFLSLQEELSITTRDSVFEAALPRAAQLANGTIQ